MQHIAFSTTFARTEESGKPALVGGVIVNTKIIGRVSVRFALN